jgi:hypothetical protein
MEETLRGIEVFQSTMHSCISSQTHLYQERLVFVLEDEGEANDNAAKNLKQLRNAVMRAGLVKHNPIEFNIPTYIKLVQYSKARTCGRCGRQSGE